MFGISPYMLISVHGSLETYNLRCHGCACTFDECINGERKVIFTHLINHSDSFIFKYETPRI